MTQAEIQNQRQFKKALTDFDVSQLDMYEEFIYEDMVRRTNISKEDALEFIINQTDGDFSQLSYELSQIAKEYCKDF